MRKRDIKERRYRAENVVKALCNERDLVFIGWNGTYENGYSKLRIYHPNENYCSFLTSYMNFVRRPPTKTQEERDKLAIADFVATGSYHKETIYTKNLFKKDKAGYTPYWDVVCPLCAVDEYAKKCESKTTFTVHMTTLKRGEVFCRCAKQYNWSKPERELQINRICKNEHLTFLEWKDDLPCKNSSSFTYLCTCGEVVEKTINMFLSGGKRCKNCSVSGFSPNKTATFYIVEWTNSEYSCLKYGITNRNHKTRITDQARKASLTPKILYTFSNDNGQVSLDTEEEVKSIYGREGVCPRELLPDGFTETVHNTPENLDKLLRIANKHFNK